MTRPASEPKKKPRFIMASDSEWALISRRAGGGVDGAEHSCSRPGSTRWCALRRTVRDALRDRRRGTALAIRERVCGRQARRDLRCPFIHAPGPAPEQTVVRKVPSARMTGLPCVASRRCERILPFCRIRHRVRRTEQARLGRDARFVRRPGDRFGDDAMTMVSEGQYTVRALGAAVAATAVCMKNYFVHGLTRAEGTPLGIMPDRRIAGSPDRRIAGSPDRRIAGSPDRRIAGSPDRRIAGSPDRRIAGSPDRRIAGSRFLRLHGGAA